MLFVIVLGRFQFLKLLPRPPCEHTDIWGKRLRDFLVSHLGDVYLTDYPHSRVEILPGCPSLGCPSHCLETLAHSLPVCPGIRSRRSMNYDRPAASLQHPYIEHSITNSLLVQSLMSEATAGGLEDRDRESAILPLPRKECRLKE